MRFDVIRTVFRKELREMLRDRRSLAVMFGIPLLLYPLVAIGMATLGSQRKNELTSQTAKVFIANAESVPHLIDLMNGQYTGLTAVKLNPGVDPERELRNGNLSAIIEAPPDAQRRSVAGEDVELRTRLDRSRTATLFVERKLDKMLEDYKKHVIQQRLALRDVPASVLEPPKTKTIDISSGTQRFGKMLAQMLPLLLLMTGMLGALFPALNATTTERELGTLETLLVTPAGRTELLIAKGALVLICGLLTAGLNMVSMALVLKRATSMLDTSAADFSVSGTALLLSYLAAVPTLILFTTLVLIMGLLARNFREANAYATPVMLLPLASLAVGIMEPRVTPAILMTPIANTTVIIRESLTGQVAPWAFIMAFAASAVYAGLMLAAAARLFSNEQLVNPSWEPLSMKGLRFGTGPAGRVRPRRLPAPDEAVALFALSLVLLFYVTPEWRDRGLFVHLFGNQLLLILAPSLLFAVVGRWKWRETFRLFPASAPAMVGAALLGIGLAPWVQFLAQLQRFVFPSESEMSQESTKLIVDALRAYPLLTIVGVGVLAGVCEEWMYRGPLQTAFVRKLPPWAAIVLVGVLFGAIHMDLAGLPIRAALGVLLGWIVWRGGSIYPAMLAHGLFDSASLSIAWWALRTQGEQALTSQPSGFHLERSDVVALALGAAAVAAGAILFRAALRSPAPLSRPAPAPNVPS
jgi:ABC-type Na+ efflux pump permease subunit/membrane protease YdiL (CAAX protease family)